MADKASDAEALARRKAAAENRLVVQAALRSEAIARKKPVPQASAVAATVTALAVIVIVIATLALALRYGN